MANNTNPNLGWTDDEDITVEFTDKQIKDLHDAGREYAGQAISDGDDIDEFDGQSEAVDMAPFALDTNELKGVAAECAADYIYGGMCEKIEEIRKEKG